MGNENPAGKLADGSTLTGQRPATPAAARRLGPLGLIYGIGTWLQFVLATVLVLPVLTVGGKNQLWGDGNAWRDAWAAHPPSGAEHSYLDHQGLPHARCRQDSMPQALGCSYVSQHQDFAAHGQFFA